MTKDELIVKNSKLQAENHDLKARVAVLERKLYWEYSYKDFDKTIKEEKYNESRYQVSHE